MGLFSSDHEWWPDAPPDYRDPYQKRCGNSEDLAKVLRKHGVDVVVSGDSIGLLSPVSIDVDFELGGDEENRAWFSPQILKHWFDFRTKAAMIGWELPTINELEKV